MCAAQTKSGICSDFTGGSYSWARDVLRAELLHFHKKGVFHHYKIPPYISLVTSTITAKFML